MIKKISYKDFEEYVSDPHKFMIKFSKENQIVKIENYLIVLDPNLFNLLLNENLSCEARVSELQNHPSIEDWPMYVDGDRHKKIRKVSQEYAIKTISVLKNNSKEIWKEVESNKINSLTVESFILSIYEIVFDIPRGVLFSLKEDIKKLHTSVLTRSLKDLNYHWEKIKNKVTAKNLSLALFMISDTIPSIKHTVGCCLASPSKNLTHNLIKEIVSKNPPFRHLSRISKRPFRFKNIEIPENRVLIFPIFSPFNVKIKEIEFGYGEHKCIGVATLTHFVRSIFENGEKENLYEYHKLESSSLSMIDKF
ncbi:hypothetical protein CBF23_014675 [Marinomonas agarivorans]|nr:hypothetical protein CBF23_014675 [Marinomonas agarivorans]